MEGHGQRDQFGRPISRQQGSEYIQRFDQERYDQGQSQTGPYPLGPASSQRPDTSGYTYRGHQPQYASQYAGNTMPYSGAPFGSDPRSQQLQYTGLMSPGVQPHMGYGIHQTQGYDTTQFSGHRAQQPSIGHSNPHYQFPSQLTQYPSYQDFLPSVQTPTQPSSEFQYGSHPHYVRRDPPTGYPQSPLDYAPQQSQYFQVPQPPVPAPHAYVEERRPNHAYSEYLRKLREAFELTAQGQLDVAGPRLMEVSELLLGRIQELGLHEDNADLQWQRYRMWKDFNHCWLAFMLRLKENLQDSLHARRAPVAPNTVIDADYLEHMGDKLVTWADGIEEYGLVDYEQGVWEEEILDLASECRELFARQPELFAQQPEVQQLQQPQQSQQPQQPQQPQQLHQPQQLQRPSQDPT